MSPSHTHQRCRPSVGPCYVLAPGPEPSLLTDWLPDKPATELARLRHRLMNTRHSEFEFSWQLLLHAGPILEVRTHSTFGVLHTQIAVRRQCEPTLAGVAIENFSRGHDTKKIFRTRSVFSVFASAIFSSTSFQCRQTRL